MRKRADLDRAKVVWRTIIQPTTKETLGVIESLQQCLAGSTRNVRHKKVVIDSCWLMEGAYSTQNCCFHPQIGGSLKANVMAV